MAGIGVIGLFLFMWFTLKERKRRYKQMEDNRYWKARRDKLFPL